MLMMEDSSGIFFPMFVNTRETFSRWWLAGMLMLKGDRSTPRLVSNENRPPGAGHLYCQPRSASIFFASSDGATAPGLASGLTLRKKHPSGKACCNLYTATLVDG